MVNGRNCYNMYTGSIYNLDTNVILCNWDLTYQCKPREMGLPNPACLEGLVWFIGV